MRMLNAKGGGGASGWWSMNRRASRIAAETSGPASVVSPLSEIPKPNESEPNHSSSSEEESEVRTHSPDTEDELTNLC
jgi:hypothetical protein